MKYIKKPIPVEAFCPTEDEIPPWFMREGVSIEYCEDEMIVSVPTLHGITECSGNDYVIQGPDGDIYPCRRDIFLKTYEKFEEGK